MVMSWFTRNAADHARGTTPSRCAARFSRCTLDSVDSVGESKGESVMKVSVVAIRLSMRSMYFIFSEDDQDASWPLSMYGK